MSKISRAYQKIFGATGVTSDFGEFGSLAAGSPTTTKDPATIQSLAAWLGGWAQATIGTLVPAYQDMNSVHYLAFYQICYLLQMGISEWDNQTEYCTNSILQYNGLLYTSLQDSNTNKQPDTQTAWWQQGLPGAEIIGVVKEYAGVTAPAGYLMCNGAAVSRSTYASLFAVCGTNYGIGDGTTTFNIPDRRRRTGVGYQSGDADFGTLGQTGGVSSVLLSGDQSGIQGHSHGVQTSTTTGPGGGYNSNYGLSHSPEGSVSTSIASADAATAHTNLQPYQVFNYIIKY